MAGIGITLAAALLASAQERTAFREPTRLSHELASMALDGESDVIVQYREGSGKQHRVMRGAKRSDLSRLAADPDVAYVSPDREIGATNLPPWLYMQAMGYSWGGLTSTERPIYSGNGVGIAIIDSGITMDSYFKGGLVCMGNRLVYSQNFVTTENTTNDLYGHGTHIAGIAGGNGGCLALAADAMSGVADEVNLINLRVLDARGKGKDSYVIAAIDRAIALKKTYNIRVINLSLGRPIHESFKTDPLCQAVERAWKAGIVVVVAAGNAGRDNSHGTNGYGTIGSPANDPYVITVGATRMAGNAGPADDTLTSYSSKGPTQIDHIVKPDLVAPGNRIYSRMAPSQYLVTNYTANYIAVQILFANLGNVFVLSGTSMAAPMASGAAALLVDQDSSLTPDQVKAKLMKYAFKGYPKNSTVTDQSGATYKVNADMFSVGAGYLDLKATLNAWYDKPAAGQLALSPWVQNVGGKLTVRKDYPNLGTSLVWGDTLDLNNEGLSIKGDK